MNGIEPIWPLAPGQASRPFQEVWYLKLNQPGSARALWLRYTLLSSVNGFRRLAEVWLVYFEKSSQGEFRKIALKQSFEMSAFASEGLGSSCRIRIGECELGVDRTRGQLTSKGRKASWNFQIREASAARFNLVPETLHRSRIIRNEAMTLGEDLRFTGILTLDGDEIRWEDASGSLAHLGGPKNGYSWIWGQSNLFVDEKGEPADLLFEGLSARARIAPTIRSPQLSAFYFRYQGQEYPLNSLWDTIRSRSRADSTRWEFQAERGDLSFRGQMSSDVRGFAGLTYEDTDGTFLYCANSKLADLYLQIYRNGRLENAFRSPAAAAFEIVTREKNPYVSMLL